MFHVRILAASLLALVAWMGAPRHALAQPSDANGVMVEVRTINVQLLRLSDFDPIHPERSPVFLTITIVNDEQERDLSVEVRASSDQYGALVTGVKRIGVVAPGQIIQLTNQDFENYEVEDAGNEVVKIALARGVLPAGDYVFDVRVFDHATRPRGDLISEDEGMIVTENPSRQLDLLGPGTPFGQEPDVLATTFPIFQWISDSKRFNFALYEVRPGQRSPEDVVGSRPVFAIRDSLMATTVLPYPSFAEELKGGQTYAWQVEAIIETAAGELTFPSELYWFMVEREEDLTTDAQGSGRVGTSPLGGSEVLRVEVEPQEITLQPGGTFLFRTTAYDANDLPVPAAAPAWSVQPPSAGSIDGDGRFTAGENEGVAAITAQIGDVLDYATVFIERPEALVAPITTLPPVDSTKLKDETVAAADSTVADSLRGVGVHIVFPSEEQQVFEPSLTFVWQTAGADTSQTLRYRVSVWPTEPNRPVDEVPDVTPLVQQTVRRATALLYPPSAPPLEPGHPYIVRVDVLDGSGNVVAQSTPVRFVMVPQDKVGWDLRRTWDNAIRQGRLQTSITLLAELRTPTLGLLDRQALLNTGVQIDLEDGPWLQLSTPVNSIPALVQLPFLRILTLPAPPWFSGASEAVAVSGGEPVSPPSTKTPPAAADAPRETAPASPEAGGAESVGVAIFEFGFDEEAVRALLEERGIPFRTHSFRRDLRIDGRNPRAAAHGLLTMRALLDYLPPEAEVHLFNFETEIEFRAALRFAVDTLGVRVASSSVSWMDAYDDYDGTGYLFGNTLGDIIGDHAVLVAAAGNFAQSHWEGAFADTDGDRAHNFTATDNFLEVELDGNEVYNFLLSWDDWENPQVDLDLYLLDETGEPLYDDLGQPVKSINRQGERQFEKPTERIRSFAPPYPGTRKYHLQIAAHALRSDAPPPHFELYMYPWPEGGMPEAQPESSLASGLAVARSASVVPVAATEFVHSSQGPTNDGRIRPDFAADGVVRVGEIEAMWPVGTSFAAPRVAAAFAHVFSRHPDWSVSEAIRFVRRFSLKGDQRAAKDNQYGWGPIDFDRLRAALR